MSVSLNTREVRGVQVLDVAGRWTVLERDPRETVRRLLQAGSREFVLRLDGVTYIDSCGLGELVALYTSVRNLGGNVRLLQPSEKVWTLLHLTRLASVFEVLEDPAPFTDAAAVSGRQ